jgi:hypothetical protein
VGSARSVFIISAFAVSALFCASTSAVSAEAENLADEPRPSGVLGHTIIRIYGALVPEGWGSDFGDNPAWGTGLGLSFGIARAVQISIGFAYHRINIISAEDWDALRQVTTSVELISPAQDLVRPWLGVGLGYYDSELYSRAFTTEKGDRRAFVTNQGSFGINWGAGIALRISERVGVEAGGRYHMSVDDPPRGDVDLLSVQAGLSYVVR